MTLIRWTPVVTAPRIDPFFHPFVRRFFDDEPAARAITPNADIRESKEEVVLTIELPGLTKEDVSITVDNGVLTVSGDRNPATDAPEEYHLRECCYGSFQRSFTLGEEIDDEKIAAKMDKGVLTITFPKKEAAKPRKIDVKVK